MTIRSRIGKTVKPFVNVSAWVDYSQVAQTTKTILGSIRGLFATPKVGRPETFDEAMERLHLTEEDLAKRKKEFTRLVIIFLLLAFIVFIYTFYLMWIGSIHGALAGLVITLVVLTQAFRYHFWLFQIKEHKLGCTIKEWLGSRII